jgi:TrmH family RNA methyltransferase
MPLSDLEPLQPRQSPQDAATARASAAEDVLDRARVVDTLPDALADCHTVAGATARSRTIGWPTLLPRECAERLAAEGAGGTAAAVFGPEKSGLTNDDLDRCHALLTIPTVPGFSSLNLGMAVQVLCYELRMAVLDDGAVVAGRETPLASGEDLERFYRHLEQVVTASGFLDPENPRHLMRRLRRLFARAEPDRNEINILRGILASLDQATGRGDSS